MIAAWASNYIGLPFRWNGYGRDGIGCYGIVALVLQEQFGIALPRHDDIADLLEAGSDAEVPDVRGWQEIQISDARAGDILHMMGMHNGKPLPMHIGLFVSPRHVLHIEKDVGSCIVDIRSKRHAWRVIGAHRHV